MNYEIIRIIDKPELLPSAAKWFHEKWGIPLEAYQESMQECLAGVNPVPQWYVALEQERIIGGLGVIENDFHNRKDLTPNVCAVYTEENRRCRGIAGALLDYVSSDMKRQGIDTLYLLTDHTSSNATDGNFSVWCRGMANPTCQECMSENNNMKIQLKELMQNDRSTRQKLLPNTAGNRRLCQ